MPLQASNLQFRKTNYYVSNEINELVGSMKYVSFVCIKVNHMFN